MSDLIVIKAGLPLNLAYKYEDILKGVDNQSKLEIVIGMFYRAAVPFCCAVRPVRRLFIL